MSPSLFQTLNHLNWGLGFFSCCLTSTKVNVHSVLKSNISQSYIFQQNNKLYIQWQCRKCFVNTLQDPYINCMGSSTQRKTFLIAWSCYSQASVFCPSLVYLASVQSWNFFEWFFQWGNSNHRISVTREEFSGARTTWGILDQASLTIGFFCTLKMNQQYTCTVCTRKQHVNIWSQFKKISHIFIVF